MHGNTIQERQLRQILQQTYHRHHPLYENITFQPMKIVLHGFQPIIHDDSKKNQNDHDSTNTKPSSSNPQWEFTFQPTHTDVDDDNEHSIPYELRFIPFHLIDFHHYHPNHPNHTLSKNPISSTKKRNTDTTTTTDRPIKFKRRR